MNIFTLIGDILHMASIVILLLKINTLKNCRGISLRTQALYLLVFVTRYTDLFWNFHSIYNSIMKVIFISTSAAIVWMMTLSKPIAATYEFSKDRLNPFLLIGPVLVLALLTTESYTPFEIGWTFSIWLESVAIVPQLFMVHAYATEHEGFLENLTSHYVFTLGGYRAMYLLNWIYRYITEPHYKAWVVWIAGALQTAIYCDFFYYYITAQMRGTQMTLPL